MLDSLKDDLALVLTCCMLVYYAVRYWAFLGGRSALRNPWISVPAVIGALGLVITFLEAWHTDRVHAGSAVARPGNLKTVIMLWGMCSATVGLGWAALARVRSAHRFARLLGIPESALDAKLSRDDADALRELAASTATQANLEHLIPLLHRRGPPAGLDWLTVDWIHQQLATRLTPMNRPDRKLSVGGA